jgi:hypothetical protein
MSGAGEVTESPSSVITLESEDKDADKPKLDASASDKWTKQASHGKCCDTVSGHRQPRRHSMPAREALEKLENLSSSRVRLDQASRERRLRNRRLPHPHPRRPTRRVNHPSSPAVENSPN